MGNKGFLKDAKPVLIFNASQVLVAICKSTNAAYQLTKGSLQSISYVCTGKNISSDGLYFRYLDPDVNVELTDIGALNLRDYDSLCGVTRRYHSVKTMAYKRSISNLKNL